MIDDRQVSVANFGPVVVMLLYQAAFVVRNPSLAVEHGVKPPSKHGPSEIRDERHAKRQAVFTAFVGIFCLLLGAEAVYVVMPVAL
ncbi:hypothetical protein BRD03_05230 [Halobacteriales archaeon QS_9_68_17]|nr:MAG: hypothetical protein BRD03_05230 [Halobacteriales archaeon QS_9_68_17]